MRRRNDAGFTLLEVMAAMVIVLMAAIVLAGAYMNVLQGYAHAERATRVNADVAFAREILFHIADLEQVEEGGDFQTADGRNVEWRAVVLPTNVADLFDVRFEVRVQGDAQHDDEEVVEEFRLLRPTWSEDDERDKLREESRQRIEEFLRDREARR
ncbi:PilW family protein [Actomonas aquatica]|uniref:Prepilin-type N-terminal cleavage/methylation domain-containing protein n=1 Tax=Actomonas aquatica TaxID=2866162 RepID=A0ABZ1C5I8_9BACT|nr:prepilin-type N-terminal cleavage/methylation domain-containing protein [Opitutus sp. WL0086]WRQ86998.1 prepilin-type N-terminal cleavage/methylation domain-containing protein [Opitutus sp. WL0086]